MHSSLPNMAVSPFRSTQVGNSIEVAVSDTGCGIPHDQLDRLFERFHRIEASGRSQEGTGIGLALVKELVRLHKGEISVTSEAGQGTTFLVSFPAGKDHLPQENIVSEISTGITPSENAYSIEALALAAGDQSSHANAVAVSAKQAGDRPTVLITDDNSDMLEYIQRLLSEKFEVVTATDGNKAMLQMLDRKPELVISDVMMPGLDGFGFVAAVRSHAALRSVPIILLSARAGDEAKVEGLKSGADDYLVKPFSAKELLVRVENLIRIIKIRLDTEKQFYQLFLQAPAIINVFKGREHVYEVFHPQNRLIFGEVDFTGQKLVDALPEVESQGIIEMLDRVFHTGVTIAKQEMPVTFINKDGKEERHFFNLTYQPWYDLRGNIQGVINFAVDVTTQVLAQHAIRESEQRLRSIITQAPVPMCIFRGQEFVVETANTQMLAFWGKTQDQVLGKSIFEGLPEIKGQGFEDILLNVYTTGERYAAFERPITLLRNGNLEKAYVNFVYQALRENDGTISGITAVAIEITDQVRARQKIEDAEEKARLAIESADLGTYEIDLATDKMHTSPRFNQIWGVADGVSRAELAERIHESDRQVRQQAHAKAQQTGALDYEARINAGEGTVRWVKIKGKVIYDVNSSPLTLLGVVQDITEQKEFSQQLSLQVDQRTIELQRSNQDLQQFAHVTSHDLKEPVRKIKLFSGRLQTEYASILPEKALGFLGKIQQSTDRMFAMIDGVLLYSSLNARQDQPQPVDLNELLTGIETDLEILINQKEATISSARLPVVEGWPVLLYQLFYNLVNNSLKFSKAQVPPVILVDYSSLPAGGIQLTVADNGIGFDQQYASHIFEPFARLNAKDDYEGTGLGLSLCRKIVERHHGSIKVESAIDAGTTFIITLPLKQPRHSLTDENYAY
ncbi:ATP-binding protein [Dyadobacter bucti]|uniref:ATP-binding protein n=1 Tax=Dyadobacter bucti TaxID=2572203 RepID=UPI0011083373|nr:ATP-binding protein [Dyadobacter bucti]